MDINDIEFVDAVFQIPKNCVHIMLEAETFENGEVHTVKAEFSPSDVRDAINLFQATEAGDYPLYVITDKGREWLEQMKTPPQERM